MPTQDDDEGTRDAPNDDDPTAKKQEGTKRAKGKKGGKKDKPKRDHGDVEIGGRVFVREKLSRESDEPNYTSKTSIASARLDVDYRWRALRAALELELERPRLKDAFIRLRAHDGYTRVDVRAGQFKVPFSAIQLESRWRLPLADRGLLDQVLVDRLQIAGRREAAELAIEGRGAWRPTLRLALFQSLDDAGDSLEAPAEDYFGKAGVARVLVTPVPGLEIGAAGQLRAGGLLVSLPPVVRRAWAAEVDVHIDVPLGPGQLRAWAEAITGTSWIVAGMDPGHTTATFASGRVILAWRAGGASHGHRYLEPYAHLGVLDPDVRFRDDVVLEASGGLTYGAWNVWRVGVEAQVWRIGQYAPIGIVELGVAPVDTTTVLLQLGARF